MKTLWCLHGNLQQPEVWHPLARSLQAQEPDLQIQLVNLWETLADDCWAWAKVFCQTVQAVADQDHCQHYILGYSLGGRLAWHALITKPELWAGAVIVSADPGISEPWKRKECLSRDRTWAHRFLTEPWDNLLAEWDDLPVFCGRPCTIPRPEAAFDRQQIAHTFEAYSKGHMDDLAHRLQILSVPITYVTGSDDRRYRELGRALSAQCLTLNHIEVADAGHRVPWEQPDALLPILTETLALHT